MNKIAVAVALWFAASASHAGFVDNRKTNAVIEVNYKSITVEDLVDDIVPGDFHVTYAKPDLRKKLLKVSGKGTWQQLLSQAAAPSNLVVKVDLPGQRVELNERVAATAPTAASLPAAAAPAVAASVATAKPAAAA
ncbi:hypothetical protein DVK02_16360, partial [Halobellus sp. Atlit-31R]